MFMYTTKAEKMYKEMKTKFEFIFSKVRNTQGKEKQTKNIALHEKNNHN